jgi:THO complex subunit 2
VPIPAHYTPDRFNQSRGHERRDGKEPRDARSRDSRDSREPRDARDQREPREPRDAREPREQRDPRPFDPARPDRPRDFPDRRGQDHGREPSRSDGSARRGESERERPRDAKSGRGQDHGRLTESPASVSTASVAVAEAPEPHINPQRAALFAQDNERPPRAPDSDRPSRGRKNAPVEPMDTVNPERAALIGNRDQTPSRAPRNETREHSSRVQSPRRGGRHGHESSQSEGSREDRHDRNYPAEHRPSSARDPRERSPLPGNRGERPADRDNDRAPAPKGRDASGFHGTPSRVSESDQKQAHQDDTYGRLNPIQTVPDIPHGPRARGRGSTRGHGGPQTLPGRLDGRFAGSEADRPPTPDRAPPTGPSGRGRRGGFEQNNGPVTPSGTPNGPQGRVRNAGQGMPSPASNNATPVGVHPERLAQIGAQTGGSVPPPPPGPPPHSHGHNHGHGRQPMPGTNTPDRNPNQGQRQTPVSYAGSPVIDVNVPTGPASSNERVRNGGGRRQLAGINSTLQQAQANMPDVSRSSSGRRGQTRQTLGGSDAQVLTGGSPTATPVQERQDPIRNESSSRAPANAEESSGRSEHERGRRDRESRSNRASRRGSRERGGRERSPGRDREGKEPREYRERHSAAGEGGREERESRRSTRDHPVAPREPMGPPPTGGRDLVQGREGRHRGDSQTGRSGEDWGGSARGGRGGQREGGLRPEDRRDGREDRGRKRRSEDGVGGLSSDREKRPRR